MASLTHRIDDELKRALEAFCDEHGLKQQAVVNQAITQWLQDSMDIQLIEERREGPWVSWSDAKKEL